MTRYPIFQPWVRAVAYWTGVAVVFLAAVVWLVRTAKCNIDCSNRGGIPVYGQCAQPMSESQR